MNIVCPNCGQTCETEDELVIGQHVLCPFCNEKFAYGDSASTEESLSAEKPMDVKCPGCGTVYEVDANDVGEEVECEVCGRKFVIGAKGTPIPHSPARKASSKPNGRKVSAKSGIKSMRGFAASTTSIDYDGNRRYFADDKLKRANMRGCLPIVVLFCAIPLTIGIACIGSGDGALVIFGLAVTLGIIGFLIHYIVKAFRLGQCPSDFEIDAQANGMGRGLDDKALNKLGLDPEEVSMVKPLKLWGYRFVYPCVLGDADDAAALWITGKDGKLRSSEVSHTIFYFGEHSVYCYVRTTSLVNCHVTNDRTEEYFYRDIVSVKTDSIVAKRGGASHKVDVFVLVNTGGERLECEVENQSEADSVARAFRTLLKQKKL